MKKDLSIDKNTLLFYFEKYEFPIDLVSKDALTNKDMIFNTEGSLPLLMNKKFKSFIENKSVYLARSTYEKKNNKKGFIENKIIKKEDKNYNNSNSNNFFNWLEEIKDENILIRNEKEFKLSIQNANAFSIIANNHKQKSYGKRLEIDISIESIFKDSKSIINNINDTNLSYSNDKAITNHVKEAIAPIDDSILSKDRNVVDIERIYRVNQCLNYPKKDPLWYIFHPIGKSSFGPLSSVHVVEMYNKQSLNGEYEIRFIDIFSIKHIAPFKYFKLKDIEKSDFIQRIIISPKVTEAMN